MLKLRSVPDCNFLVVKKKKEKKGKEGGNIVETI